MSTPEASNGDSKPQHQAFEDQIFDLEELSQKVREAANIRIVALPYLIDPAEDEKLREKTGMPHTTTLDKPL